MNLVIPILFYFLINDTIPSHIQIHNNQNNNINLGITGMNNSFYD